MARPKKDGLDYFPVDVDFDGDDKIEAIILLHKNDGIIWVFRFWQKAYKTLTGLVDLRGLFAELFANKCRITIEEHQKILETALNVHFCYEFEEGVYTSDGIQKRISAVSKEREAAVLRQKERKEKKSKSRVKKRKVKDCPDYSANNSGTIPEYLSNIWNDYREMRKKIKKPMTEKAEELALNKLFKLSNSSDIQILIVEQSVMNSWQGLFKLKNNNTSTGRVQHEYERGASSKYECM